MEGLVADTKEPIKIDEFQRVLATINLDHISHNLDVISGEQSNSLKFYGVIKADAGKGSKNGQSRNMLNHLLTGRKCLWTRKCT